MSVLIEVFSVIENLPMERTQKVWLGVAIVIILAVVGITLLMLGLKLGTSPSTVLPNTTTTPTSGSSSHTTATTTTTPKNSQQSQSSSQGSSLCSSITPTSQCTTCTCTTSATTTNTFVVPENPQGALGSLSIFMVATTIAAILFLARERKMNPLDSKETG